MDTLLTLSVHRALFCAIPRNLNGLRVIVHGNNKLIWQAFFDNEPTEGEIEVLSVACTEVLADFPNIDIVEEEYLCRPAKLNVYSMEEWAFVRWEP